MKVFKSVFLLRDGNRERPAQFENLTDNNRLLIRPVIHSITPFKMSSQVRKVSHFLRQSDAL